MTKISHIQSEVLTAAAQAQDGWIAADGAYSKSAVAGLIKRGLLISIPQADEPSRLTITTEGRAALGVGDEQPAARTETPPGPPSAALAPKGKIGGCCQSNGDSSLLRRSEPKPTRRPPMTARHSASAAERRSL